MFLTLDITQILSYIKVYNRLFNFEILQPNLFYCIKADFSVQKKSRQGLLQNKKRILIISDRINIFLIFTIALLVRLIGIFILRSTEFPDQEFFLSHVREILGGTYDSTFRTAGYPLFIVLNFILFGSSLTAVKVVQAFVDILSLFLVFKLTLNLFGRRAAFFALIAASLYPYSIFYTGMIAPETLFSFIIVLSITLLLWFYKEPQFS